MSDHCLRLLRMPLFPLPVSFSEEQQAMRKAQVVSDLMILYPKLAEISQCAVDYKYEADGDYLYLVVELISIPQEALRFDGGRYANADWRSQLGDVAEVILESANTTQANIYQLTKEANMPMPVVDDARFRAEIKLEAMARKYRNQVVSVDTAIGQQRFDFPEFNTQVLINTPVNVSGFVESVGRDGFTIVSVKGNLAEINCLPPPRQKKLKVFYQREKHNALSLGMRALEAATDGQRIGMRVHVCADTLNFRVNHFVLESSEILID